MLGATDFDAGSRCRDGLFGSWQIAVERAFSALSGNTHHLIQNSFSPTELPMPQTAKHEPFSRLAADVALEHPGLKAIRETRGYSIEELSLTCGLSTSEISDIESGKDTDPSKLRRIAAALQLPETALIDAPAPTAPVENRSVS
jgi:DNA-binding XRE family transcriptional regulator